MFGYEPHEKPHKPSAWQDMIVQEDLNVALDNFNKHVASKGKHPYEQEVRYRHKNGKIITVLCRGKVIEWQGDDPVRMIGTHTDITELKEKTKALEKALNFQKLLFQVNTDLVFVKDESSVIVEANSAFINLYAEDKRDKVIGYTTVEDYDEQQAEDFLAADKKAFIEGTSEVTETIDFPDGITRTLLTKKLRFEDLDNEAYILCIARDITKIKNTEEELIQANSELEEFSYRTSHDLRSPLVSSIKMLNIIKEQIDEGEYNEAIDYLGLVEGSLDKLQNLVCDILDLAKINQGTLDTVEINIPRLLNDCLSKLNHMDNYEHIRFNIDLADTGKVLLPIEHVKTIFENLISNAIKYSDLDERQGAVSITIKTDSHNLNAEISDNGLGIPERYHPKLFEMFKRFHPNTSFGSGLGLYMVKKSIEKLNGKISYESNGKGSKFIFSIPMKYQ